VNLLDWLRNHDPEFRLAFRVTIAAAIAFLLARLLQLPQGFWAVITAVIVIQGSVGGSLKAALDRFVGTLAGAVTGAAVAIALPHASTATLCLAIMVAVAPLALLAALKPGFRVAPVTALIMLLPASGLAVDPWIAAFDRVLEIAIGDIVGVAVALLVLPARAHANVTKGASRIASLNADLLRVLLDGSLSGEGRTGAPAIHARIRAALKELEAAADEAGRERRSHLTEEPDPEPLLRSLYRLRHDLVMIGRAASIALPPALMERMAEPLASVRDAAETRLRELAVALVEGREPQPSERLDAATKAYASAIEALRSDGLLRAQPGAVIGRFWTLPFAFEQLHQDLNEIARLASNWAGRNEAEPAPSR
jgi:uncharacterized membrane protein YccC